MYEDNSKLYCDDETMKKQPCRSTLCRGNHRGCCMYNKRQYSMCMDKNDNDSPIFHED